MQANLEVNPADIKFSQDSISLYFQSPYDKFSVREAVIKLSKDEMRPDDFPPIRVNSCGGCLWSIDNRRLWVFRMARCSSIHVKLENKMHPRVKDVLLNGKLYSTMLVEDFFPRLRDRGKKDRNFDQRFPQPVSSLQLPVDEAIEKPPINVAQVSNVDTEISWTSLMPAKPSINPVEEHKYGVEEHTEISWTSLMPAKPSINPVEEHKYGVEEHKYRQIEINIVQECGPSGKKDRNFDQRFPQPVSSLQLLVDEALEKPPINVAQVSNVDTEISWTGLMPAKPSINPVEEHKYGQIEINIVKECNFDQQFPQPVSSLHLPVDEALEKPPINVAQVCNVETEISGTSTTPAKPSINSLEEHKYGQIEIYIVKECEPSGKKDRTFDQRFPQPVSSLQLPVDHEALENPPITVAQVSNVETEISGTSTMYAKSSINPMEGHKYGQIEIIIVKECATTGPTKPSIHPTEDLVGKIANVGRMIRNAVGSVVLKICSVARIAAAAVARTISS